MTRRNWALIGRLLLSGTAVVLVIGAYLADWNATHLYNPRWPPHAKFHSGQTLAMAVVLAACGVFFVWRKKGDLHTNILAGAMFLATYWLTQAAACFYPGVAFKDPEFLNPGQSLTDVPPQLITDVIFCIIIGVSTALVWRMDEHRP